MVDVMQPDVARGPLQQLRQVQVRAPLQGGGVVAPALVVLPVGRLELVLHVEEPDADHHGEDRGGQLDHQEGAVPHQRPHHHHEREEADDGPEDAAPFLGPVAGHDRREAVADVEMQNGADAEEHDGVAVEAVLEPAPGGPGQILVDRERVDVPEAAVLEVARGGVMEGVGLLPIMVRRQREDAEHRAHHVGDAVGAEKAAVPAIVLDDEKPDEQERRRYREEQGEPVAHAEAEVHQHPGTREQRDAARQLPDTAFELGAAIRGEARRPGRSTGTVSCGGGHLWRKVIRPRVRSYGETARVTRSPASTRMRKRRILPAMVASTSCPFVSFTRNIALGSNSSTMPSISIASSFAITPPVWGRNAEAGSACWPNPAWSSARGGRTRRTTRSHKPSENSARSQTRPLTGSANTTISRGRCCTDTTGTGRAGRRPSRSAPAPERSRCAPGSRPRRASTPAGTPSAARSSS